MKNSMVVQAPATDGVLGPTIDASRVSRADLVRECQDRLASHHAFTLSKFPLEPSTYIDFLSRFGTPLENYSKKSTLPDNDLHQCINRIVYVAGKGNERGQHRGSGELPIHSARSWRDPRPRYFAMLFVNIGWIDYATGQNGESRLVRWRDALGYFRDRYPEMFRRDFDHLRSVPVTFLADNVREAVSALPIIYDVAAPDDPLDYGMRIKYNLVEKLEKAEPPIDPHFIESVARLCRIVNALEVEVTFQAQEGQMIFIDNNRFGHGRYPFVAEREVDGEVICNTRELWSVTVD